MSFVYIFGVYGAFFAIILAVMVISRMIRALVFNIKENNRFSEMRETANNRLAEYLPDLERSIVNELPPESRKGNIHIPPHTNRGSSNSQSMEQRLVGKTTTPLRYP
tara:strand:+ start:390 stop:710 length:321 start_codon:yes stop_codon:yes gene_type:complete